MIVSFARHSGLTLPVTGGWVIVVSGALAVFATYWDEAWHTDVGRDTALSAPHLLLYGAVGAVGAVVAAWGVLTLIRGRSWRAALGDRPLLVAGAGGAAALVAAPVDAFWHAQYGRDAVLWSPPHILVIFASTALLLGVLAALPRDRGALRVGVGMLLLANLVATVFEYEADVPQFSEVLYLPLLLVCGLLVGHLVAPHLPVRLPVTTMVLSYVALRLAVSAGLAGLDRSTPDLPIAVLGLAAMDLPLRSVAHRAAAAIAATTGLALAASAVGLASPAPGAVLAAAVPALAIACLLLLPRRRRSVGPALVLLLGAAAATIGPPLPPAAAHDPGQGETVTQAVVTAHSDGEGEIRLVVHDLEAHCADLEPVRVVARRAGETSTGDLRRTSDCGFTGSVAVTAHGRWFGYAEFRHGEEVVETWLPIDAGEEETVSGTRTLYRPPRGQDSVSSGQVLFGAGIYAVGLSLLGAGIAVNRRTRTTVGG
jgi:hypothetical protein